MVLWYAGMGLQGLLVLVMLTKGIWNKFPVFFSYSLFALAASVGAYAVRSSPFLYFYLYWVGEAVGLLLGIAVFFEIFRKLLRPYMALRRTATLILSLAVAALVGLSVLSAYAQPPGNHSSLATAMLVGEEATRIFEIGLLMFLFIFSTAFGLHWRQQAFGITLGLGIFVAIELIGVTMRAHLGTLPAGTFAIFSMVRMVSFDLSLLVWMGYMLFPERAVVGAEMPKRAQLEEWNQAVMELIHQ
jgi:hypothetical protein